MSESADKAWEAGWSSLLTHLYRLLMSPSPSRQLTKSQRLALLCLAGSESLSMGQIAAFLTSSREQATRAVAALASAGLVERTVDPANRSRVLVRLSEAGRASMESYQEQIRDKVQRQLEQLSGEERRELDQSLLCVTHFLQQLD